MKKREFGLQGFQGCSKGKPILKNAERAKVLHKLVMMHIANKILALQNTDKRRRL